MVGIWSSVLEDFGFELTSDVDKYLDERTQILRQGKSFDPAHSDLNRETSLA